MGKNQAIFLILLSSMVLAMSLVQGTSQSPKEVENWFQTLSNKTEKLTKLRFYFHDILSGKNPTAVMRARANVTDNSPTFFGALLAMDDALTVGPEPNSTVVGRAQGFYGSVGIDQFSLHMNMNYVFTSGEYNGSTLSVLGRNPALDLFREFPIIGGTGVFRLARGIVTAKTYWLNATSGDAIVEHNLIVIHY